MVLKKDFLVNHFSGQLFVRGMGELRQTTTDTNIILGIFSIYFPEKSIQYLTKLIYIRYSTTFITIKKVNDGNFSKLLCLKI